MSFIGVLSKGFGGLIYFWYITIILVILLGISIYLVYKQKIKKSKQLIYLLLYPILLPIIISILGAIYFDTKNNFAVVLTLIAYLLGVVYYLILLFKMKSFRLLIFSFIGLILFLSFWVMFIVGMSITNDWI